MLRVIVVVVSMLFVAAGTFAAEPARLEISWKNNFLTIAGEHVPGKTVEIHYLEAYCRPGSTDRDWAETVIGHRTELVATAKDGREIRLRDTLRDGVIVEHVITAGADEVDVRIEARNPTQQASQAHWAQPCMRIDKFTGCDPKDARVEQPPYIRQCFLFLDGKLTRLPTDPWATKARYIPGQTYCPAHVDRNDVNPRPLSKLVPSSSLTGCYSKDGKQMLAVAFEPYQEVFQGVITCMHTDFRLGGLKPGETKQVRGKFYLVPANAEALLTRFEKDFPEQARGKRKADDKRP